MTSAGIPSAITNTAFLVFCADRPLQKNNNKISQPARMYFIALTLLPKTIILLLIVFIQSLKQPHYTVYIIISGILPLQCRSKISHVIIILTLGIQPSFWNRSIIIC